jgi:hypothetical protein
MLPLRSSISAAAATQEDSMRMVRASLIGSLAAASLIIGALPAIAADTKGTLAIVNGIPGKKVDICLNGREIKSRLAYGGKVLMATVATGPKTIKFYAPDPRRCRGTLVGKDQFPLPAAADKTIVVTKLAPKVLVFDNLDLGEIPPLGLPTTLSPYAIRHAAEIAADMGYQYYNPPPDGGGTFTPSAIFTKGQQFKQGGAGGFVPDYVFEVRAALVGGTTVISAPLFRAVQSHRYDFVLVGTNASNARWASWAR